MHRWRVCNRLFDMIYGCKFVYAFGLCKLDKMLGFSKIYCSIVLSHSFMSEALVTSGLEASKKKGMSDRIIESLNFITLNDPMYRKV